MYFQIACGAILVFVSILGLLCNIPFMIVVFRPSSRPQSCFFMLAGWLALADSICLILMISYAAPCIVLQRDIGGGQISAIMGGIINVGFFTSLPLIVFLAVDRWLCLCHRDWFMKTYDDQKTKLYIAICWLFGLAYSTSTFTSCCPLYFDYVMMTWTWSAKHPGSQKMAIGELVIVITTVILAHICNTLVLR